MSYKSEFLSFISERGFINNCTNIEKLDHLMHNKSVKAYIGFDCTASSLHIGSLMQIILLKYLQKFGHTPVVVMGGGTTEVGDPSGRDEARKLLNKESIQNNLDSIKKVIDKFLDHDCENAPIYVNNIEWLGNISFLDFLREYGKEFSINRMLTFESVKSRLDREQSLSFLEFSYMLLQSVDFYFLNKIYDVQLQLGGSDQWGNIVNGVDLTRRKLEQEVYGLTTHLLTKSDGTKMGKTASGAVWLDDNLFSSWDFYQFLRNTDDADVIKYLKIFTEIPLAEIGKLSKLEGKEINEAKKILAYEVTKLVHGEEKAKIAEQTATNTFEKSSVDNNLPTIFYTAEALNNGLNIIDFLVENSLMSSKSEARKMISNNGIKINNVACQSAQDSISNTNLENEAIKVSIGKKKHILIKLSS